MGFTIAVSVFLATAGAMFGCTPRGTSPGAAPGQPPDTVSRLTAMLRETSPAHQPKERDALARRQADAAIALLRLGRSDAVWPVLRLTPDPGTRTYLVHAFGPSGIDPAILLRELETNRDLSVRRALILSLGHFTREQLPDSLRQPIVARLLRWYRDDPDPGVHASIDWLLRHGRQGARPRVLDWNQSNALRVTDSTLAGRAADGRRWYVTREWQTMAVIRGPVEFEMGSPDYEVGRMPASDSPDELRHLTRIPRSFAISSKEITVAEFRRFLDANPEVKRRHAYADNPDRMARVLEQFSPDDTGPQVAVTWYEAAMYCNWLSHREGIPRSEWVYPTDFAGMRAGMRLSPDYLRRTGYRLPTEAEWEYAARAGTKSSRFYGTSDSLLENFAWYSKYPPRGKNDPVDPRNPARTWPVGQLEPNDFGLFDVYGNVWEWTEDRMQPYPAPGTRHDDIEDSALVVGDSTSRSRRGGSFSYEAAMMRSAGRGTLTAFPFLRRDNVGFRVARTLGTAP